MSPVLININTELKAAADIRLGVGFRYSRPQDPIEMMADETDDRYFTQKKATSYNLTGWVRNTPNSKVSSLLLLTLISYPDTDNVPTGRR